MAVFDVGGTKTDAVLFDTTGKITARKTTAGGVPLDIGTEAARENYHKVLSALTEETGIVPDTVYGSIATVEYFGTDIYDHLSEKLASPHIRLEGDGPCMISGMLGHTDGCSLVCGTGSSLYTRKGDKYWHTGGWGYLFDSCGSGYVLGRLAIQASLRAHDGRAEPTLLSDLIEKQCGEPAWEHYVKLHRGGRPYIASFAGTVFEARDAEIPSQEGYSTSVPPSLPTRYGRRTEHTEVPSLSSTTAGYSSITANMPRRSEAFLPPTSPRSSRIQSLSTAAPSKLCTTSD